MHNRIVKVLLSEPQKKHLFPHSGLQLFADGGDGSGDGGDPGKEDGSEDAEEDDDKDAEDEDQLSFDELLKQKGNQEEFDRRVRAAVSTAIIKEQKRWKSMTDDKLSEAEKLAKMTKEEKDEYLRRKEREEFEAEKADFEKEKLLVEVSKELQAQRLPTAFAKALVSISDAERIKDAISEIKETWDAEIAEAVKAKARQSTPPEGGNVVKGINGMASIRKMANENRIIKN